MPRRGARQHGPTRRRAWQHAVGLAAGLVAAPAGPASACVSQPPIVATIDAVEPSGDLRLGDGRLIRLAHVETVDRDGPGRLLSGLRDAGVTTGTAIGVSILDEGADRWGRAPAWIMRSDGQAMRFGADRHDASAWINADLVARGAARARPETVGIPCNAAVLRQEDHARRARAGGWSGSWHLAEARNPSAIAAQHGQEVIVEGRVLSVGERTNRIYLNFGRRWSEDFTVAMSPRVWNQWRMRGVDARAVTGKTVRIRGLVEIAGGPIINVALPDQIELVE